MRKRYLATLIVAVVTAIGSTGCISSYSSSSNMPTINFDDYTYSPETTKPTEPETTRPTELETTRPTEPETTKPTEPATVKPVETEPETTEPIETEPVILKDGKTLLRIGSTTAKCETDYNVCRVDVNSEHNPYDVIWDYGEEYDTYVDACDWSLVWDYEYYIKTFPMLAELYHYDKDLLLEHFQTVGVHEGRQGSADFNFYAFRMNSECPDYERVYAAYYFDYMLNYDLYKNVNTVNIINDEICLQYDFILTATQKQELGWVNKYRNEVNVDNIYCYGELSCFANLRGYINVHDDYYAHEWFEVNDFENARKYAEILDPNYERISENCIERNWYDLSGSYIFACDYAASKSHYEAMIDSSYLGIGISNVYYNVDACRSCQFDVFIGKNSDGL